MEPGSEDALEERLLRELALDDDERERPHEVPDEDADSRRREDDDEEEPDEEDDEDDDERDEPPNPREPPKLPPVRCADTGNAQAKSSPRTRSRAHAQRMLRASTIRGIVASEMRGRLIDLAIALAAGGLAWWLSGGVHDSAPPPEVALTRERVDAVFDGEVELATALGFATGEQRVEAGATPWSEEASLDADDCLDVVAAGGPETPIRLALHRDGEPALEDGPDHVVHVQLCAREPTALRVTIDAESGPRPALRVVVGRATVLGIGGEARLSRPAGRLGWAEADRRVHERVMARARADERTGPAAHDLRIEPTDGVHLLGRGTATCLAAERLLGLPDVEGEPCRTANENPQRAPTARVTLGEHTLRVLAIFDPESLEHATRIEAMRLLARHRGPPLVLIRVPLDGARLEPWATLPDAEDGWRTRRVVDRTVLAIAVPDTDREAWALRVVPLDEPLAGSPRLPPLRQPPPLAERCAQGDGAACGLAGYEERRHGRTVEAEAHFEHGCDLGDGRSCAALAIARDNSVRLFARGCFAGYASACRSAIRHHPEGSAWTVDRETRTRLRLVQAPPDDPRIPRLGETLSTDCAMVTHAERAGQLLCGRFSFGRWGSEHNHNVQRYLIVGDDAALLFGDIPWSPPPSTTLAPPAFWPAHGRTYVVPRALLEEGAELPAAPGATTDGALPADGILVAYEHDDLDRTVWMDLATRRTVLWLDDLPVAELVASDAPAPRRVGAGP